MDPIDGEFMEEDDGEYFVRPEPKKYGVTTALDGLEMVPVVYTTRLDDMDVLNSFLPNQHPRELTAKILKESKPELYTCSNNNSGRINKLSFRSLEEKLKKMYYNSQKFNIKEEPDMQLPTLEVNPNLINTEISHESNATRKYNELLKLCKPLSIVLTKLELTLKSKLKVIHDQPKRQTVSTDTYDIEEMEHLKEVGPTSPTQISHLNYSGCRLLTNGIMELHDLYSDEYTIYCTDYKGNLLDCFVDSPDNKFKYQSIRDSAEIALYFKYCCWVKRNEHLQSLYPKVLLYTNLRFMKKPHLCPIDECICCCRKRDEFTKPDIAIESAKVSKVKPSAYLKEDLEIQELDDEIQDIIQMNTAPRLNTNQWLRALLTKASSGPPVQSQTQTSLIEKALSYKPKPKKQTENRRLLTVQQEKTQPDVIVFRNFAWDERDVYEINANGELQFYTKLTCFNNASRLDVKKLLQKPKSVKDVCCWFKRESIIYELFNSKSLHSSTLKFMRVRHACLSDKCNCCCKPRAIKETTLSDVPFSQQYTFRPLNTYKKGTKLLNNTNAAKSKSNLQSSTITKETNKKPTILRKTLVSQPKNNNLTKTRPESSVTAETITLNNADDDCEIVAVRPAIQFLPVLPNPLPVEQVNVATVVNVPNISNRDMAEEVNTTVAAILEKFKDVRLTINSNGKVVAALNMPINTLSTVELKVLASILSYAQSQINLLGLKSEMSLSTFISRSATDNAPYSENNVDETSQELNPVGCNNTDNLSSTNFVVNNNITQTPNSIDTDITCKTEVDSNVLDESDTEKQSKLTELATDFDDIRIIPPTKTKENVFNLFTNAASARNPNFNDSFASFIATQYTYPPKDQSTPVITSVYSMYQENANTHFKDLEVMLSPENQLSGAKTFGEPAKKFENLNKKRKQDNSKTQGSKRIRVLSPSQLGADSISEPNEIYNTFCYPVQKSQTMEVCGFTSGVPLLANNNFQLQSLGDPKAQQGEIKTQQIPEPNLNPSLSNLSGSSKTLLVAPLIIGNINAGAVNVPVTVSSLTSGATSTEESHALSIKEESDDYCILGM